MTLEQAAKALGVSVNATKAEVKKAYKALAKQCHPDRFTDEAEKKRAEKLFMKINEAFEFFEKHFASQNTNAGAGQNTGGAQRPGGATRPGNTQRPGGASRPGTTGANTSNNTWGDENFVKACWDSYQRACKLHETFLDKELYPSTKKLQSIEDALRRAMDKQDLDSIAKLSYELGTAAQAHKFLIGRAQIYKRQKDDALNYYNAALAKYGHAKNNGGR